MRKPKPKRITMKNGVPGVEFMANTGEGQTPKRIRMVKKAYDFIVKYTKLITIKPAKIYRWQRGQRGDFRKDERPPYQYGCVQSLTDWMRGEWPETIRLSGKKLDPEDIYGAMDYLDRGPKSSYHREHGHHNSRRRNPNRDTRTMAPLSARLRRGAS